MNLSRKNVSAARVIAFFAFVAVLTTSGVRAADNPTGIKRVVFIGVDGGGAFFKQADTPNLDKIFADGAVTYQCLTEKPSISAQNWGSMLHGVSPEFHKLTNWVAHTQVYPADSPYPSVFRVIRENMPDAKLVSICSWDQINRGIIEDGIGVEKDRAVDDDAAVTDKVCEYLEKNDPTFLFVHFNEVDHAGHSHIYGAAEHLEQIRLSDGYIGKTYDTLKKRGMADSTLFIVTADHGGSGRNHGGWSDAEKRVMFAAVGPNVVKGEIGEMSVRDSAAIILYALGLADKRPATWTSRVPSGLFKGVEAKERPEVELKLEHSFRVHKPTPTPKDGENAPSRLGKDRVLAYLPFDGDVADALGKVETKQGGTPSFIDGFFDKGEQFDDGSVAISDFKPGKESFSFAFWIKTNGAAEDPVIASNKDWSRGVSPGFCFTLRNEYFGFNVADGKNRADLNFGYPSQFYCGWTYVVVAVDRQAGKICVSYDFNPFVWQEIPDALKDASFDSFPVFAIGQDARGEYRLSLPAELDEFILVKGALTNADVETLKKVYVGGEE